MKKAVLAGLVYHEQAKMHWGCSKCWGCSVRAVISAQKDEDMAWCFSVMPIDRNTTSEHKQNPQEVLSEHQREMLFHSVRVPNHPHRLLRHLLESQ